MLFTCVVLLNLSSGYVLEAMQVITKPIWLYRFIIINCWIPFSFVYFGFLVMHILVVFLSCYMLSSYCVYEHFFFFFFTFYFLSMFHFVHVEESWFKATFL